MPRGERGGKKVRRSENLTRETESGLHHPKRAPSSSTGVSRYNRVLGEVAFEAAKSKTSSAPLTPPKESRAIPKSTPEEPEDVLEIITTSVRTIQLPPAPPPKATCSANSEPAVAKPIASSKALVTPVTVGTEVQVVGETVSKASQKRDLTVEILDSPKAKRRAWLSAPRAANQEVWVSLDYNHVCNVAQVGDRPIDTIHPLNSVALRSFIDRNSDRGFRVGITSYIGEAGPHSQSRRHSLLRAVREFNGNQPDPEKRVGVRVVNKPYDKAPFLSRAGAAVHADDRIDILNKIEGDCVTIWLSTAARSRHLLVSSLPQALKLIEERAKATLHQQDFEIFWQIPQLGIWSLQRSILETCLALAREVRVADWYSVSA